MYKLFFFLFVITITTIIFVNITSKKNDTPENKNDKD